MSTVAFHKITQFNYCSRYVHQHDWWVSPTGKWADRKHIGDTVYCSIEGGNDGGPIGEAVGLPEYPPFKDADGSVKLTPEQGFARKFVDLTLSIFPGLTAADVGKMAMLQVKKFDLACGRKVGYYVKEYPYRKYENYPAYKALVERVFTSARPSINMVTSRVCAMLRHRRTTYDRLLKKGISREEARYQVQPIIASELENLRKPKLETAK